MMTMVAVLVLMLLISSPLACAQQPGVSTTSSGGNSSSSSGGGATAAAAAAAINFRHCYLLFGDVDDLGFSHTVNLGRLDTQKYLVKKYGATHNITMKAVQSAFFKPADEQRRILTSFIADDRCNVITGSSNMFNASIALQFPNVTFVIIEHPSPDPKPGNFIEVSSRPEFVNYEIAAAAAVHSKKCIGFISAWEDYSEPWSQAMGSVMGVRSINSSFPVHLVTMDSWYRPDAERVVANLLHDKFGCEVILRRTDPSTSDKAMSLTATTMTVAPHIDMQLYMGDSAFSSAISNWGVLFSQISEASLNASQVNNSGNLYGQIHGQIGGVDADDGFFEAASYSPRVAADAIQASVDAHNYLLTRNGRSTICRPLKLRDGSDLPLSSNPTADGLCLHPAAELDHYVQFDNVIYHDAFADGGEVCTGGNFYTYDDTLQPTCHLCPVNTYRPASQARAFDGFCEGCPVGRETHGKVGATECLPPEQNTDLIVAVTVSCVIAVLAVIAVVLVLLNSKSDARDNKHAPKDCTGEKPISIIFTDIQASTKLWANAPQVMSGAVEQHHTIIRKQIKKFKGYEVKTIGDAFMIVHEDPKKAVELALAIQVALFKHDWETTEIDSIYEEIQLEAEQEKNRKQQQQNDDGPGTYLLCLGKDQVGAFNGGGGSVSVSPSVTPGISPAVTPTTRSPQTQRLLPITVTTTEGEEQQVVSTSGSRRASRGGESTGGTDADRVSPIIIDVGSFPQQGAPPPSEGGISSYSPAAVRTGGTSGGSGSWNGLRVRIGVHTGICSGVEDEVTKGWDYYGTAVNTAARVEATGHGGQTVITQETIDAILHRTERSSDSSSGRAAPMALAPAAATTATASAAVAPVAMPLTPNPSPLRSKASYLEGAEQQQQMQQQMQPDSTTFSNMEVLWLAHGDILLRGLEDKVGLHSILPKELVGRSPFPPLRIDAPTDLIDDDEDDTHHETATMTSTEGGGVSLTVRSVRSNRSRRSLRPGGGGGGGGGAATASQHSETMSRMSHQPHNQHGELSLEALVDRVYPPARGSQLALTDSILSHYHTLVTIFSALPEKEKKSSVERVAACWSVPGSRSRAPGLQKFAKKFGPHAPEVMQLAVKVHQVTVVRKEKEEAKAYAAQLAATGYAATGVDDFNVE